MRLRITRPLVGLDLEATGPWPKYDRIVEITAVKVLPCSSGTAGGTTLVNPGRPIPASSTAIHGITDDMVKDAPTFDVVAPKLHRFLSGADLFGYHVGSFDRQLLDAEFHRVGAPSTDDDMRIVDPRAVYVKDDPRSLKDCHRRYTGRELEDAHRTAGDVLGTLDAFLAQLEKVELLQAEPPTVETIHALMREDRIDSDGKFRWHDGRAIIAFGEQAGTPLEDVERGFLRWMVGKGIPAFRADAIKIAEDALRGTFPMKGETA